ncbi:CrpH [Nitrospira japonica]|uniref:CrpH n=1 Tax=Nitrospira japonica TaxID=1325564 RepID=A0A1W1IAN6_9BACT|nr:NAD(P)/FAD-dependent oxidoreductase [Nitrospira japonica]SLM49939.1 CrpH [Nitrospira japonica]
MMDRSTRVLVVGGGPAGSTTTTLLAQRGVDVILAEREQGARYHIGESLLPSCLRILDLLGVREKVERHGFVRKDGGYFVWGEQPWEAAFGSLTTPLYGFQVVRSEFDKILIDHASSQGVSVLEGHEVKQLDLVDGRPVAAPAVDSEGNRVRLTFDFLVDATGRSGLMATGYLRNRYYHKAFMNVATWGYWRKAKRLSVGPQGAIATCSIPIGWIWAIPLHDGQLSVDVVMHKSKFKPLRQHLSLEGVYRHALAYSELIQDLISGGELQLPLRAETDYSYTAEEFAGPGYYLVGDAACILDPLLSTGVHMATFSGLLTAASLSSAISGDVPASDATQFYSASYRRAYLRMMVVVASFYQTHRGAEAYFRQAQQLTSHDYSGAELAHAFLHIISGIEDLKDIEDVEPQRLLEALTNV